MRRSHRTPGGLVSTYRWNNGNVTTSFQVVPRTEHIDIKSDTRRNKMVNGWRPPSPYSRTVRACVNPTGRRRFVYDGLYEADEYGQFPLGPDYMTTNRFTLNPPSWMVDSAIIDAYLKIRNLQVDFGTAIATANQTASLIADSALSIYKSYSAFRRGDFPRAAALLGLKPRPRNLASHWLAYQYGVKPLLSDVNGAVRSLISSSLSQYRMTGVSTVGDSFKATDVVQGGLNNLNTTVTDYEGMYKAKVRIDVTPHPSFFTNLNNLGLTDPATVAWEVVPFSFVIDWFLPVGDFLGALNVLRSVSLHGGTITTVCEYTGKTRAGTYPGGTYIRDVRQTFEGLGRVKHMQRSVMFDLPFPNLSISRSPFSVTRALNAIALLTSLRRHH